MSSTHLIDLIDDKEIDCKANGGSEIERLREKICDLERTIVHQQHEILLLQTTTSDVLRRLQILEGAQLQQPNNRFNSLPRQIKPSQTIDCFSLISPTEKTTDALRPNSTTTPRRRMDSGTMRKSTSTLDGKQRRLSTSSTASSTLTRIGSKLKTNNNVSMLSLNSSSTSCSKRSRKIPRTCQYSPESRILTISSSNNNIDIPVPSELESYDPLSSQLPPNVKVSMKHVYSYRGNDIRRNVEALPTGECIFFTSNIVVLMDLKNKHVQRFYAEHTADVKCIALHPNKVLVASGQMSCHGTNRYRKHEKLEPVDNEDELVKQLENQHTEAHIRIWDSVKLSTVIIIGGYNAPFEKGICQLSFSTFDSGAHLACVDDGLRHQLTVWNWSNCQKIAETKAANDIVFECQWHPIVKNVIIVYGKGHFSTFKFDKSNGLLVKSSLAFKGRDKPKTILSICTDSKGNILTGDSNGTISIWNMETLETTLQAFSVHQGGVFALSIAKNGKLWSGGKDRFIAEWDAADLIRTRRSVELPDHQGYSRIIRCLNGNELIIGTSLNCLLIGNVKENDIIFTTLIMGDSEPITGLCLTPSYKMITATESGMLRVYSKDERRIEWTRKYMIGINCIDNINNHLTIGLKNGKWMILDIDSKEVVAESKEELANIISIKMAPIGCTFAISCSNPSRLLIYQFDINKKNIQLISNSKLNEDVVAIDWSTDAKYIRTNIKSAPYLTIYDRCGDMINDLESVRDIQWETTNCLISFESSLIGLSDEYSSVSKSTNGKLLAFGMKNGLIRFTSNPITSLTPGYIDLSAHTCSVPFIKFSRNELISISNVDNSIIEWDIKEETVHLNDDSTLNMTS